MNGLAFAAFVGVGYVIGALWALLRHGGLLDTRACLSLGHQREGKDGRCARCGTQMLRAAL